MNIGSFGSLEEENKPYSTAALHPKILTAGLRCVYRALILMCTYICKNIRIFFFNIFFKINLWAYILVLNHICFICWCIPDTPLACSHSGDFQHQHWETLSWANASEITVSFFTDQGWKFLFILCQSHSLEHIPWVTVSGQNWLLVLAPACI